ncbi:MAG: C1 family peptidase, partial [Ginsengibacter sp.]
MKKIFFPLIVCIILSTGCSKTSPDDKPTGDGRSLGWNAQDNPSQIPQSINNQIFSSTGGATEPSVDLTPYLPPIGDQGQTGTCVAWASGYYTRTAADAIANNYTQAQLSSPTYEFSPKHLFTAIADNLKGADCNGTNFTAALDIMQGGGVATLATVPFSNLGNCSSSLIDPTWSANAQDHKISNYRAVNKSVDAIKVELAKKNPVIFGAKLPDQFLSWQGGAQVLSGQATYTQGGGGHAMTIVGYDDSKQAFRIANSWGTSWADNGYMWIDYNYMVNSFITDGNLYVLNVTGGGPNPSPNPNPGGSNIDLATWVYQDFSTASQTGFANTRTMLFDIYNIGT